MLRRLITLTLLFVTLSGIAVVADFRGFLKQPINLGDDTLLFEVSPGVSLKQVANDLYNRGLLSRPGYWQILARFQGKAEEIKAGEYRLENPLTPGQLLDQLVTGKTAQYSLTLLEGWTFEQMLEALAQHPQIEHTLTKETDLMAMLGVPDMPPEGWFYPDTYHFPNGTTDVDLLKRSHAYMEKRLQDEWQARVQELPLKTPYEALTLASIVEKETAVANERPKIAAVFLSRLEKGMRLQTDPTVIYGLGDGFDGDITYRNLRHDTPYNTYLHKGLTPTPIAMPGGESLHAVLNPANIKALYFVAKGDGSHYFSKTYKEHREAVIRYQLHGEKKRYRSQAQR
ncbi:MAG: endolytic transglycosylase MltG [Gammaproteobacteria bacterium]|nr:endolytic transglycosylase MltG [Gammaproteobacteria bacterium]